MELALSEQQKMLKETARTFLRKECPSSLVRAMESDERGYHEPLWREMGRLGWLGMLFPAEYGGAAEGCFRDATLIVEEFGHAALPSPFFSSVVESGILLLEAGSAAQKQRYLPAIARGELHVSLALTEPDWRWEPIGISLTAQPSRGGFILNGVKLGVPNAHVAQALIVAARTSEDVDGISLFLVDAADPAIARTPLVTTAGDKLFEVKLKGVVIGPDSLVGTLHRGWALLRRVLDKAAVLKAAELVGGCQASLDLTLAYAKVRIQFGKPIGSFQAVHHHFANMYRDIELSRRLAYQAAWCLERGVPATKEVAMAKSKASSTALNVVELAHRVHGGVGYFADYDLQLYTRRAIGGAAAYGDATYHNERIAAELQRMETGPGQHLY